MAIVSNRNDSSSRCRKDGPKESLEWAIRFLPTESRRLVPGTSRTPAIQYAPSERPGVPAHGSVPVKNEKRPTRRGQDNGPVHERGRPRGEQIPTQSDQPRISRRRPARISSPPCGGQKTSRRSRVQTGAATQQPNTNITIPATNGTAGTLRSVTGYPQRIGDNSGTYDADPKGSPALCPTTAGSGVSWL